MSSNKCACLKQIVWFFEKPTIIVCEKCEITLHYEDQKCRICGGKLTKFVKKDLLE